MRLLLPVSLALGALSLALPVSPGYDAWSWLVWGRELAHLDLDTTGGTSWKPLPVLVTSILWPFGDAAPTLWLLVVRTATFLSLGLAARLALRLAGPLAAAVAPILMLLTPNPDARFFLYAAHGFAEPLIVALLLGGIERHLDGRRDHALVLGVLAALLRPEVWPFLGLYALWLWFAEPRRRRLAIGLLPLVPLLWLGGDWLGSGGVLTGADRARVAGDEAPAMQLAQAHAEVFEVVTAPVWVAAVVAMLVSLRRREPFVVPVADARRGRPTSGKPLARAGWALGPALSASPSEAASALFPPQHRGQSHPWSITNDAMPRHRGPAANGGLRFSPDAARRLGCPRRLTEEAKQLGLPCIAPPPRAPGGIWYIPIASPEDEERLLEDTYRRRRAAGHPPTGDPSVAAHRGARC